MGILAKIPKRSREGRLSGLQDTSWADRADHLQLMAIAIKYALLCHPVTLDEFLNFSNHGFFICKIQIIISMPGDLSSCEY